MVDLPEPESPVSQITAPRWPSRTARSRAATWVCCSVKLAEAGATARILAWSVAGASGCVHVLRRRHPAIPRRNARNARGPPVLPPVRQQQAPPPPEATVQPSAPPTASHEYGSAQSGWPSPQGSTQISLVGSHMPDRHSLPSVHGQPCAERVGPEKAQV